MDYNSNFSIVIPCYKSSQTIETVVKLTSDELLKIGIEHFEFILVNDCSPDDGRTMTVLKQLTKKYKNITAIDLAKNGGQHNATMCGLNFAEGDYIISMDDDMQTHPSQLIKLISAIDDQTDIVYGYYPDKKHNILRNLFSIINYWSVRILIGKPKELKTSSFWIIRRYVRNYIVQFKNKDCYLQGLFLRTTKNIKSIPVEHFERKIGTSNYTFKKLLMLYIKMLCYSIIPIRMASIFGFLFSFIGFIASIIVFILKLMNPQVVSGYTSLMFAICFFSGLILFFIGIIGEYIARIFSSESNDPQFVIRKVYK